MKITGEITRTGVIAIKCDLCSKTYRDVMEIQEFLSWSNDCGYGNRTFGDLNRIEVDLCQYCVKDLLEPFIKVVLPYRGLSDIELSIELEKDRENEQ